MKKVIIISLIFLVSTLCQAQTSDEWFHQKATQKKYLIEQIVALKVYIDYVQKGYTIAQIGLNTINSIKKRDFDLHHEFFKALGNINAKIGKYAKVADIVALQLMVVQVYKDIYKLARTSGQFNAKEINYVSNVFRAVLNDCASILLELTDVITPFALEMTDNERLERIDALYANMQEAYTFAQSFGAGVKLLGIQRLKDKADIQAIRVLHDIKTK